MEEAEVPLEQVHEDIHHHAEHSGVRWTMGVALTSALLAGLAAVTSLLSGHHANEAMVSQIKCSDQWNYYQAKGVKAVVLNSKMEMLMALGKTPDPQDQKKLAEYKQEQEQIKTEAEKLEQASENHLRHHVIFARGVTLFQVAIAVAAISVLTNRRKFWLVSIGFGIVGMGFLLQALLLH